VAFARRLAAFALVVLLGAVAGAPIARAEPGFPSLTGRVVDQANVLSSDTRAAVETKLKSLEDKSGIQLVVATVSSLDGLEIEPYANQLFRSWKLGETKKNNGVLFLIAPKEHRVRIEVGYGLEGALTDATSKIIIANAVAPRFKAGDFNGGVSRGVDDIITVLTTDASEWQKRPLVRQEDDSSIVPLVIALLIFSIFIYSFIHTVRQQGGVGRALFYMWLASGNTRGGNSGGSFGGGGGFSGGGGSSGGGGASGSW
jgi:uncharacterized protein